MADFKELNDLSPERKMLIVNAQTLVDETRIGIKEKGYLIGLVGKGQLKDDCKVIDRLIKKIRKGKAKDKDFQELELAVVRLKTTSEGILNYKY